ncbi:YihY family inner membrane protein [Andreprevotia chitinilytica]|uniref:YihY family inner membrane protein n=1 Tax=Andreprevotia chitinilytica TaxID=396808 RepID=UPI00068F2A59|nr:YihY family inner membrane protein [Andreprevotia chitinilytica]
MRPIQFPPLPKSLDFLKDWQRLLGFGRFVGARLGADRCLQTAGSLTYTTLLAIVPLFTIALTLFSAFPMFSDYSGRFRMFILSNLVPDTAGKVVGTYMKQFSDNAEKLTAAGTIGLAITALLLMFTIEKTLNQIWGVRRPRALLSRTLIYWATLTLGPLLLGISLSLTSWFYQTTGIGGSFPLMLRLGPLLLIFATLTLLYMAVPNCFVPRSHALTAAVVAGLLLEIMKNLFGLYISHFGNYKMLYGAFAAAPIFLLWLYVCWVIVLGGAVLSASLSYWHGDGWRWTRHDGTRFEQAIRILLTLAQAHANGEILHIDTLRRRVGLGLDATNGLLESMAQRGWVEATRDGEWLLASAIEHIRLLDIFEQVVTPLTAHAEIKLEATIAGMRTSLNQTLADYAAREEDQAQPAARAA